MAPRDADNYVPASQPKLPTHHASGHGKTQKKARADLNKSLPAPLDSIIYQQPPTIKLSRINKKKGWVATATYQLEGDYQHWVGQSQALVTEGPVSRVMSNRFGVLSLFGVTVTLLAGVGAITALSAPNDYTSTTYNTAQNIAIAGEVVDQHWGDGTLEGILRASGVKFKSDLHENDVKARFNWPKLLARYCLGSRGEDNAACQTYYSQLVAQAGQQSPK